MVCDQATHQTINALKVFTDKTILIISPESWRHLFVSKHHYAVELARRGNTVFFLNPPTDHYAVNATDVKGVYEIEYTPFVRGLRFFPRFLQKIYFAWKFNKLQRLAGKQVDIVWSFDNSVFFDYSFLPPHVLSINHIVDYSQNFQFEKSAKTADICFGLSSNIVSRLAAFNPEAHLISHGLSVHHVEIPDVTLPGKNAVKAVYAGNLDSRSIDRDTLFAMIDKHPEVDFVFYGSGGSSWKKKENIFLQGKVPRDVLMNYLKKADILLLIYDWINNQDQWTNSHKILEYLYSGKVIVSNYLSDYEDKKHLLQMAKDPSSIVALFSNTLKNLDELNSAKNQQLRHQFAAGNTYDKRLDEIEMFISNLKKVKMPRHS
jgi:hypothetical protein